MAGKKRKIRVEFRKNRQNRARSNDLTRDISDAGDDRSSHAGSERMTGKGDLTRYRTVVVDEETEGSPQRDVSPDDCAEGRVLSAVGLNCFVQGRDGETYECTVRRVVRTMSRDSRNAVVTGDRVLFRPSGSRSESEVPQGVIERVEPRKGVVSRRQDNREHVLAANVDQAAIVASADEPPLKPSLIDRFIVSCEKGGVEPLVCVNKADLVPPRSLDSLVRLYANLGYRVLPTSIIDGRGVAELRSLLAGKTTVFTGQSGVGKSSLLNTTQPSLDLKTGDVSDWTMKGRHTTRRAVLLPLEGGGYVVDTPGIRQFLLWEVDPAEVEG
ncbi:MAG: ribosome small subunit-dependent GTPase A [Planctomycetota bacterium]|nr:ribosome small subunit-dependent GTPase A [Planctomycetota bacterium]